MNQNTIIFKLHILKSVKHGGSILLKIIISLTEYIRGVASSF